MAIIAHNPRGYMEPSFRETIENMLQEYASCSPEIDPSDIVFLIGAQVYGATIEFPHHNDDDDEDEDTKEEAAHGGAAEGGGGGGGENHHHQKKCIVDFDYMKQFMKDVFLSYGVTPERAEICSEVLIEADRRGIDSHGLGRLKPIYCDRMDQEILWPDRPITIVKETDTTALVDGNLGLGLYIGPYCMQLAIDKAKKHGVGFVAVQNSTVRFVFV